MLMSVSSQWGLGAEAQATLSVPTVRTGLECPEGNQNKLTCASKPDSGIGTT